MSLFNIFFLNFSPVHAYVGPGMGGGLIAATLGIILAIFAALFAIVWFPFKRFLKKRKNNRDNENKKI
ncbi:hypothetical protein AKH21_00760 [Pelagibacteraceae bacterium GOM-A5]|nr:hypothetical protein AKH21_00760 [Pelagibacteraceae bacterium GOM-A5]